MPNEIATSREGAVTLMKIKGTIIGPTDRESIQIKIQELLEANQTSVILDLGEVTFIDSSGIGALVASSNLVNRKCGCMRLLHVTKKIHDVLQITRLSSVFGMYDDLQKALDSFEDGA